MFTLHPSIPKGGQFLTSVTPPYQLGDQIQFQCTEGHITPDNPIVTLIRNPTTGQVKWNVEMECFLSAKLRLPYKGEGVVGFKPMSKPPYPLGYTETPICQQYYVTQPDSMATVIEYKGELVWDKHTVHCVPLTCPTPPVIPHSKIKDGKYKIDETFQYSCEEGYQLINTVLYRCTKKQEWNPPIVPNQQKCIPLECLETLKAPLNGTVNLIDRFLNSIATYSCDPGYQFVGLTRQRQCMIDGNWSGKEGKCIRVSDPPSLSEPPIPLECPDTLTAPLHGTLDLIDRFLNSIATYSCDPGYKFVGHTRQRQCMIDGNWSGEEGKCIRISDLLSISETPVPPISKPPVPPISKPSVFNPVPWILWVSLSILLICVIWSIQKRLK